MGDLLRTPDLMKLPDTSHAVQADARNGLSAEVQHA